MILETSPGKNDALHHGPVRTIDTSYNYKASEGDRTQAMLLHTTETRIGRMLNMAMYSLNASSTKKTVTAVLLVLYRLKSMKRGYILSAPCGVSRARLPVCRKSGAKLIIVVL